MIALLLAAALMQQPKDGCLPIKTLDSTACMVDPTKPLKCGKYQHVESYTHYYKDNTQIDYGPIAHCVDNLHILTEREWQELIKRLKKLESK